MTIKKITAGLLSLVAPLMFVVPALAFAQASAEPITVQVSDLSIPTTDYSDGRTISGTFSVTASSDASVYYSTKIVGGSGNVYEAVLGGPLTVTANQAKNVPFSIKIPQGLVGSNLTLRAEAQTVDGKAGSADQKIAVTGNDSYLTLVSSGITADGKTIKSGTTVQPGSSFMFSATLNNTGFGYGITPKLSLYKDGLYGKPVKTVTETPITIENGTNVDVGFVLPDMPKGNYTARVEFFDQNNLKRAADVFFAYGVAESPVTVQSVTASKNSLAMGDTVDLTLNYSVSPVTLNAKDMNISVVLFDEQNLSVGAANATLDTSATTSTQHISVKATAPAKALRIEAVVKHFDTLINTYKANLSPDYTNVANQPVATSQPQSIPGIALAIILTTIVIMIGILLIAFKKHRMGIMMIALTLLGGSVVLIPQTTHAAYCSPGVDMTLQNWTDAVHDGQISFSGWTFSGQNAYKTMTNNTDCNAPVSLASYKVFDTAHLSTQTAYRTTPVTELLAHQSLTLSVGIPTCTSQIDVWYNSALTTLQDIDYYPQVPAAIVHGSTGRTYTSYTLINGSGQTPADQFCQKAPNVPGTPVATASCGGTINITWTAPAAGGGSVTGYHIYRDGGTTPIGTTAGLTFTDSGAGMTSAHTYKVDAYNADAASSRSNASNSTQSTTACPGKPTGVTATPGSCGASTAISVSWTAGANATSYNLYDGATKITGVTSPYNHTGLTPGSSHSYIVESVNSGGTAKSNPAIGANAPAVCPTTPTVSLKVNNSHGPVTIANGGSGNITWTSANADTCTASGAPSWSGSQTTSNSTGVTTGVLSSASSPYTVILSCTNTASGLSAQDQVTVNVDSGGLFSVACHPENPATGATISRAPKGQPVNWVATGPAGGTYTWTTTDNSGLTGSGQTLTWTYDTTGMKNASVSYNGGAPVLCTAVSFTVSNLPGYKEF